ncbi:MAG TPA: DegT/DnrJ/EryC1/StrS family aminotransferase [Terriglobia bacterium]|nr:DegT/DnrJ/EryC1/StrS family aminotransferase [Terriglobia bacterium]
MSAEQKEDRRSLNQPVASSAALQRADASAPQYLFPFVDLKAQFAALREDLMAAVSRVFESQQFILGREVEALEQELAAMLEVKEAVTCASGTAALELALQALGIGPSDEVITTPFTFVATGGAVAQLRARPVFVDIEPRTFNLDPSLIEPSITSKTRAIIPVHLFGLPSELDSMLEIARRHKLAVVEDAAQAIGARYQGRPVGGFGTAGCFSFFPSKNLGAAGDGGLIATQDSQLADRLRLIRVHGSRERYHYEMLGTNSRLDGLQAAVLRVKLRHLSEWTRRRQEAARRYDTLFAEAGLGNQIALPSVPAGRTHVYNQYVIRCQQRDALREFLRKHGIPAEIYYPVPLHLQPAFASLGYRAGQFPVAEAACAEVLALPIYPELKESHQRAVVEAIAKFYRM